MRRWIAAMLFVLGLVAGSMAAAANVKATATPATTTITLTGKISAGRDSVGLFGPWGSNLAGKAFSASYTVTTFANSSVAAGIDVVGLTSPTTVPSSVTTINFSITINGRTFAASANSFGSVESEDGVAGLFAGGFDRVQASAEQAITTGAVTKTFAMSATVQSAIHNMLSDTGNTTVLPNMTYTVKAGDSATGQFQYSQSAGSPSTLSYGLMSISQISVSSTPAYLPLAAVPEPGEWAMMLAGIGVVAFVGSRRRNRVRL